MKFVPKSVWWDSMALQTEHNLKSGTGTSGGAAPERGFEADTIAAVTQIRDAYARIIETKCPGSKAVTAVSEAFGIHRKLAWQVVKVAYAEDPFVATRHMPPGKSVGVWLDSARDAGVDGALIDSAQRACDRLARVIDTHASSRAEFEMLIESFGQACDVATEEKWRQHAFMGNSFTLGVQCRVLLAMCVLMPSEDKEDYFHSVQVRGLMGYRQTRPGVRWVLNQSVALDDASHHEIMMTRRALDPEAAERHNGVPVLPEFCSDPAPRLARHRTPEGLMQDELLASEVGLRGQRTLVTGEILRNIAPVYATENDRTAHFGSAVRIPTRMLHFDLFVRRGLFGDVRRELRVFSELATAVTFDERDELSVCDGISRMGRGVSLAQAPDIAGYPDLARSVFDRLSIDPGEYELHRIRMAYPPLPATVVMKHELLPRDGVRGRAGGLTE